MDVGAIIFPPQIELIEAHVRDAVSKGARVRHGRQAGRSRGRPFLRADRARRGRSLDAVHDRGDLRPDPAGDEGRRRPRRRCGWPTTGPTASRRRCGPATPRNGERDRPPGRGRGLLRQRRPAQLRRARAADGRLEGLGARLATRPGRDPQVRQAPVADDHARLRARRASCTMFPYSAEVTQQVGDAISALATSELFTDAQRAHPARPLRHPDPVAAPALGQETDGAGDPHGFWARAASHLGVPEAIEIALAESAATEDELDGLRLAARLARRARDGRRDAARGPRAARSRLRRLGPRGARRASTPCAAWRCRSSTLCPTSARGEIRAGTRSAIRGRGASRPPSRSRSPFAAPRPEARR